MTRARSRIGTAIRRGSARADTWVAALGFFFAGRSAADNGWIAAASFAAAGVVFLVASGDYAWRKGYVAGARGDRR